MTKRSLLAAILLAAGLPAVAGAQQPQVLVILDCSWSMNEKPQGANATRLELAKQALTGELEAAAQAKRNVGLMLFGHRVGWQPGTQTLLKQTRWSRDIPNDLMPYEDVELVQAPGLYGPQQHKAVTELLETLRPWGETPQYFAVQMAATQLGKGDRILLITDGVNQVFQPRQDRDVKVAAVLEGVQAAGVRLDVVALDPDEKAGWQELANVAKQTSGTWAEVKQGNGLGKAIAAGLK